MTTLNMATHHDETCGTLRGPESDGIDRDFALMKHAPGQLEPLVTCDSPKQELQLIVQRIKALGLARGKLRILEAGCGNAWQLELPGVTYELTGLDLNKEALTIRKDKRKDLDAAILGDLRTVVLEEESYDVIYNSFVLEHVCDAELVLDNFSRWLRPGGILILRIPDPQSVYGFLSKLTPFWFHVFYKRYIAGVKTAGKPGYDPFPTVYDAIVCRNGINHWCEARSMTIREEIGWDYPVGRPGLTSAVVNGAIKSMSVISLGRLAADHVNLTYVIEKNELDTKPLAVSDATGRSDEER